MAAKCDPSSKADPKPKRQRKMMTIAEKVKLLDVLKEGRTFAAVARLYGVNESTVRYIKKEEENIRKTASISFHQSAKRVVTPRNKTIVRMEAVLALWIADCRKKNIALDSNTIQTKARSLYETFAAKEPEDDSGDREDVEDAQPRTSSDSPPKKRQFFASKGWFAKFQKRFGLKYVSLQGVAASADIVTDENFMHEIFKKIIYEAHLLDTEDEAKNELPIVNCIKTEVMEESEDFDQVSLTIKDEELRYTQEMLPQEVMMELPMVIENVKQEVKSEPCESCEAEKPEDPLAIIEDTSWIVQGSEMCQQCGYTSESKLEMESHLKMSHGEKGSTRR